MLTRRNWPFGDEVAPVVDDLPDRFVVVTIYTFYFQEGEVP